jgi:MFS transporter, YNFM family, putative membrane transport protein
MNSPKAQHVTAESGQYESTKYMTTVPNDFLRKASVAIAGVCAFLNLYAPQPILPRLAKLFNVTAGEISFTVSATTLGVALSAPFVGMLADRFGRKRVIVVSLFGLALSTVLSATATGLPELIVYRFLTGISTPGIIASILAYIAEEWASGGAAGTIAIYVSGTILGGFVGRVSTGFLAEHGGWRLAFLILGIATLIGASVVLRFLPASRNFVRQSSWHQSLKDFIHHLKNPILIATYAVGFSVLFSLVATFTYITFYLAAPPYNLGPAAQGMLFFVYLLGLVITPMSGSWIQRLGHHRMVPVAVAFSSLGVLLTLSGPIWLIVLGLALCSSGVFVCQAASSGYVGLAADRARSAAAGLYVTFYYLGGSAGAVLPGYIWSIAGWSGCIALIVAVQIFAGTIALLFWKNPSF